MHELMNEYCPIGLCLLTNVDFLGRNVDGRELVVQVSQVNTGLSYLTVTCSKQRVTALVKKKIRRETDREQY